MNVYCITLLQKANGYTLEQHVRADDEAEAIAIVEAQHGIRLQKPDVTFRRALDDEESVATVAMRALG
jgi:hypothetical protein